MHQTKLPKLADPLFRQGHNLIYEADIPVYIRYLDSDKIMKTIAERELLNAKILTLGPYGHMESLKLHFTSESDLFFSSSFNCDQDRFEIMKRKQDIPGDFQQFPAYIMKLLNSLSVKQEKLGADLVIYTDSKSNLTINKNLQIKTMELLAVDLVTASHNLVEESIAYRYITLKDKVKKAENRLKLVSDILLEKNPSLASQIGRTYTKF